VEPLDWTHLSVNRQRMTCALDEESVQTQYDAWKRRLLRRDRLAEQQLDEELLELLVQIQDAV